MANEFSGTSVDPTPAREKIDQVAKASHEAIESMASKAGPALEEMQENIQETADTLSDLQERWTRSARAYVREHPVAAVLTGVAAGMLISRLVR